MHVNSGEFFETSDDKNSDFFFIETQEPDQVVQRLVSLVTERKDHRQVCLVICFDSDHFPLELEFDALVCWGRNGTNLRQLGSS